eukprot:6203631-Pleurochrysis_carterae.AAC.2
MTRPHTQCKRLQTLPLPDLAASLVSRGGARLRSTLGSSATAAETRREPSPRPTARSAFPRSSARWEGATIPRPSPRRNPLLFSPVPAAQSTPRPALIHSSPRPNPTLPSPQWPTSGVRAPSCALFEASKLQSVRSAPTAGRGSLDDLTRTGWLSATAFEAVGMGGFEALFASCVLLASCQHLCLAADTF